MQDERKTGILRTFKLSLQALALPPDEQVRVTSPGCVTCDLSEDFRLYHELFLEEWGGTLTAEQQEALAQVAKTLDAVPMEALQCFDASMLEHEAWGAVRRMAEGALKALGWAVEAPPAFQEEQPGVWRRPV